MENYTQAADYFNSENNKSSANDVLQKTAFLLTTTRGAADPSLDNYARAANIFEEVRGTGGREGGRDGREGGREGGSRGPMILRVLFSPPLPSLPPSFPPSLTPSLLLLDGRCGAGQPSVAIQRQEPLHERPTLLYGYGGRGREKGREGGRDTLKRTTMRDEDGQGWTKRKGGWGRIKRASASSRITNTNTNTTSSFFFPPPPSFLALCTAGGGEAEIGPLQGV